MKKTVFLIVFAVMLIGILSAETTKNEMNAGVNANTNKDEENSYTLPYITHAFEFEKKQFVLGLESEMMLDFDDEFENEFVLTTTPSVEYGITEMLTTKLALPLEYSDNDLSKNLEAEFTFGNLEEDIEGLTPWASFEQGFNLGSVYFQELKDDAENGINLNLDYSYYNEQNNFMVKPSLGFSKDLSENDSDIEENFSLNLAKDFSNWLTLNVGLESDIDFEYSNNIEVYFYPIEKFELSVSSNITEDDYEVGFGIDYLIFD